MSAHTPGPWQVDELETGVRTIPRSRGAIGGCAGIAIADVHPAMTDDERTANTRLIAAAPTLLAALRDVLDEAEQREDVRDGGDGQPRPDAWMHVAQIARAAIAKAEGR